MRGPRTDRSLIAGELGSEECQVTRSQELEGRVTTRSRRLTAKDARVSMGLERGHATTATANRHSSRGYNTGALGYSTPTFALCTAGSAGSRFPFSDAFRRSVR